MIKISKRLMKISSFIEEDNKIIDIGCDHGLLDVYLVSKYPDLKIIATDKRESALNGAKNNIKKYGMENNIETRLGNGLDIVDSDEIDTIVMSGLGSHTIVGILINNLKKLSNVETIVVQSNNHLDFLRKRIVSLGYYIDKEELVKDANIIYTIIRFKKGRRFYTRKELYFGPILMKEKGPLFDEKKKYDLMLLNKIYSSIPRSHIHHKLSIWSQIRLFK